MFARSLGRCSQVLQVVSGQRALIPSHTLSYVGHRAFSSCRSNEAKLQVGDRVLLRWKQGKFPKRKLTKPLREGRETIVDNHVIHHREIIGQDSDVALFKVSKDGTRKLKVFARHPTIDEFTALSPRRVAPIYASYASTIVSLLDINVDPPSRENDPDLVGGPTFQLLEAGTGHGSLTLQLARAIAPANLHVTADIHPSDQADRDTDEDEKIGDDEAPSEALMAWRKQRRAVIHTVDIDPHNRRHADKLIRSFRGAVYWPHIDFHTGNVKEWLQQKSTALAQRPFLDAVVLDMPGLEAYISAVKDSIKDRGHLLVFAPQITQIATCVQEIVTKQLGLRLEKVIELGDNISTGRAWDVRMADLKHSRVSRHAEQGTFTQDDEASLSESSEFDMPRQGPTQAAVGTIPPMVCRPIVGELTRGGGFIAIWKKFGPMNDASI